MYEVEDWPVFHTPGCDNEVNPKRVEAIGETRCMTCPAPPHSVLIIDMPKSNPMSNKRRASDD